MVHVPGILIGSGLGLAAFLAGSGAALAACGEYVVQRGDTLRTIAIRQYGSDAETLRLFEMNRDVIGDNMDLIEIGQVLQLPCGGPEPGSMTVEGPLDGSSSFASLKLGSAMPDMASGMDGGVEYMVENVDGMPMAQDAPSLDMALELAERMAAESGQVPGHGEGAMSEPAGEMMPEPVFDPMPEPVPEPMHETMPEQAPGAMDGGGGAQEVSMIAEAIYAAPPGDGVLHLLTGGPFPPFVDSTREAGGLMPHLVEAALFKTPEPVGFEIAFVNDQAALLDTIMPRGGFDLVFPFVYPDCARGGLDEAALRLCSFYLASDPIYEMVTEFYTRTNSPRAGALVAADLTGAVVCRPVGTPVNDLESIGLLPDNIQLVRGSSPSECLQWLDEGLVDVASMDGSVARTLIRSIGISQPLVVLDRFTRVETLHLLAPKSDPMAQAKLAAFNAGLLRISESGEWFEIVNKHISVQ